MKIAIFEEINQHHFGQNQKEFSQDPVQKVHLKYQVYYDGSYCAYHHFFFT